MMHRFEGLDGFLAVVLDSVQGTLLTLSLIISTFLTRSATSQSSSYPFVLTKLGGPRSRHNPQLKFIFITKTCITYFGSGTQQSTLQKMIHWTSDFNFPSIGLYVYTCLEPIKARLYSFIEKSYIRPYSTRNSNNYDVNYCPTRIQYPAIFGFKII